MCSVERIASYVFFGCSLVAGCAPEGVLYALRLQSFHGIDSVGSAHGGEFSGVL
jgi:hypothetical protein